MAPAVHPPNSPQSPFISSGRTDATRPVASGGICVS